MEALAEADIYNHLCETADDFRYPSQEAIKEYAKKLSEYADFMTMRDPQGNFLGIVAYYSNNGNFTYVSHVWVAKCLRGGGIVANC